MRRLTILLLAFAFALPASASAKTLELDWSERLVVKRKAKMLFTVRTVTLGNGRWQVRASFTNRSGQRLRVSRNFGLAHAEYRGDVSTGDDVLRASRFSPAMPRYIKNGQTWRGTFSGRGMPPRGNYVKVMFGFFHGAVIPDRSGFYYFTQHTFRHR